MNLQVVYNFRSDSPSPCLSCNMAMKDKTECSESCKPLEEYAVSMGYRQPTDPLPQHIFRKVNFSTELSTGAE